MTTEHKSLWTQAKTPLIALSCVTALSVFALIARPVQADEATSEVEPRTEIVAKPDAAESVNPMVNVLSDTPSSTSIVASETAMSQPATPGTTAVEETASAVARGTAIENANISDTIRPEANSAATSDDKVPDEAIDVTDEKPSSETQPSEDVTTETSTSEETSTETNITGGHFYPDKDGNWHYKDTDGKDLVGPQIIGGNHYYFGDDGVQVKGDFAKDGHFYEGQFGHLVKDSFVTTGDNHWYYVDNNGNKLTGLQKIGENTYHFAEDGRQTKGNRVVIDGKGYYFHSQNGELGNNRLLEESRYYYVNGTYDKSVYLYDDEGNRVKGARTIDGKEYYFLPSMVYSTKFKNPDGTESYYDESGAKVYSGWGKLRYMYLRGYLWFPRVYADENGHIVHGFKTIDSHLYYFDESGSLRDDVPGSTKPLFSVDGNLYFADFHREHGDTVAAILTNQIFSHYKWSGWNDNVFLGTYLADSNGKLTKLTATNQYVNVGDKWYYLDEKGRVVTGDKIIDSRQVHFDKYGVQTKGHFADDGHYYDKDTGAQVTGRYVEENGDWYYVDANGNKVTGAQTIDNVHVYFDKDGKQVKGAFAEDGHYYDKHNGWLVTHAYVEENGSWYYVDDKGNKLTGPQSIDGVEVYFDESGKQAKGVFANADHFYDKDTGALVRNQMVNLDGKRYYIGPEGRKVYSGSYIVNGEEVHILAGRTYQAFGEFTDNGDTGDYIGFDGKKVTTAGFVTTQEGNWYYLDGKGGRLVGPQILNGNYYYFGVPFAKYYYGKQVRNTLEDHVYADIIPNSSGIYLFTGENGAALKNTYAEWDGHWYYFGPNWYALIGPQTIDGVHVYFHNDGKQAKGELVTKDGVTRYYDEHSGALAENTTLTIKGVTYRFDQDGRGRIVS